MRNRVIIRNHLENFLIATGDIYESRLSEDALPGRNDRLIQNLTGYIRSHFDLPSAFHPWQSAFIFSPEYLSRYFKRHTGQTISSYLSDVRMKKARSFCFTPLIPSPKSAISADILPTPISENILQKNSAFPRGDLGNSPFPCPRIRPVKGNKVLSKPQFQTDNLLHGLLRHLSILIDADVPGNRSPFSLQP